MIQLASVLPPTVKGPARVALLGESGASSFALALGSLLTPAVSPGPQIGAEGAAIVPDALRQIPAEGGKPLPVPALETPDASGGGTPDAETSPEHDANFAWFAAPPAPAAPLERVSTGKTPGSPEAEAAMTAALPETKEVVPARPRRGAAVAHPAARTAAPDVAVAEAPELPATPRTKRGASAVKPDAELPANAAPKLDAALVTATPNAAVPDTLPTSVAPARQTAKRAASVTQQVASSTQMPVTADAAPQLTAARAPAPVSAPQPVTTPVGAPEPVKTDTVAAPTPAARDAKPSPIEALPDAAKPVRQIASAQPRPAQTVAQPAADQPAPVAAVLPEAPAIEAKARVTAVAQARPEIRSTAQRLQGAPVSTSARDSAEAPVVAVPTVEQTSTLATRTPVTVRPAAVPPVRIDAAPGPMPVTDIETPAVPFVIETAATPISRSAAAPAAISPIAPMPQAPARFAPVAVATPQVAAPAPEAPRVAEAVVDPATSPGAPVIVPSTQAAPAPVTQPAVTPAPEIRVEAKPAALTAAVAQTPVPAFRSPVVNQPVLQPAVVATPAVPTLEPIAFAPIRRVVTRAGEAPVFASLTTPSTVPTHQVAATPDTQQAPLDTRQQEWVGRMIDRIEMLRDAAAPARAQETRISLMPDALGKVDIAVRHEGDRVHVHFQTETLAARQVIADAQPRLSELAEQRGLRLGQTSVDSGAGGQGSQRQDTAHRPQPPSAPPSARSRSTNTETDERVA